MPEKEKKPKKPRNQWTLWFAQMLDIEAKDYGLEIDFEHELFRNPLKIDVLVVKKPENVVIENSAMKFFRNHNIIEFKGPVDNLTIEKYNKVMGYFYVYLAERKVNYDDVAITLVSVKKPTDLLEYLEKERKYEIIPAKERGIYYICSRGIPATQLIVSREAEAKDLTWVKALRDDLTVEDGLELVDTFGNKEVVLSLLLANENLLEEINNMQVKSPRAMKIVKMWMQEGRQEGMQQGMQQGMRARAEAIARNMKDMGIDTNTIAKATGLFVDDILRL